MVGRGSRGLRGARRRSQVVGTVGALLELPSCEVLEVTRGPGDAPDLLVPLIQDAVRSVDLEAGVIDVDLAFLGEGVMEIDVFTLFPEAFSWFTGQRHVTNAARRGALGGAGQLPRPHTPLSAGQVDDTPFGGGAGMVLRIDVVEAALRARYGRRSRRASGHGGGCWRWTPGGRVLDDGLSCDELAAEPALTTAVRPLRGIRRADPGALRHRPRLDRPLRAGRRGAGRDGRLRRGAAQAARVAWARRLRGRGVVQRRAGGRARVSALHAPRRRGAAGTCRRSCSPGHHANIARWRREQSRERAARARSAGASGRRRHQPRWSRYHGPPRGLRPPVGTPCRLR